MMHLRTATRVSSCAALMGLALSGPALAQQTPSAANPRATTPAQATVDVDRLPIDLDRIERQLRKTGERQEFDGLRLRYFVDVYGRAPRIELFAPGENLTTGPVPWGAPTHQDMLNQVTPKEFRSPPMDLNAVMRWLSDKIGK